MKSPLKVVLLSALVLVPGGVFGTLINYFGFDGEAGSAAHGYVTNLSGTDAMTWSTQSNNETAYTFANTTPLTYGTLVTTPGYVIGGGAYLRGSISLNANSTSTWSALGMVSSPFTNQIVDRGSIWASFLIRRDSTSDTTNFAIGGAGITAANNANTNLAISATNNAAYTVTYKSGAGTTHSTGTIPGTSSSVGNVDFIVMNIDFGDGTGDITYRVWVDPNLAAPGEAHFSATASWADMLNKSNTQNGVRGAWYYPGSAANRGSLDELRFGTTYASVAPVPEPAAVAALLGLLALGAALVSRRRK